MECEQSDIAFSAVWPNTCNIIVESIHPMQYTQRFCHHLGSDKTRVDAHVSTWLVIYGWLWGVWHYGCGSWTTQDGMASRPVLVVGTRSRTALIFLRHQPHIVGTLPAGDIADYRSVLSSFFVIFRQADLPCLNCQEYSSVFFSHVSCSFTRSANKWNISGTQWPSSCSSTVLVEQADDAQSLHKSLTL